MSSRLWAALTFGLMLFVGQGAALAQSQPEFPALSGRVVDQAELLDAPTEAELTTKLAALEQQTGDQLVVVTVNSLQDYPIEDYGYRLGRAWGIGQSENDGGALLIVAPNERRVRVEVGYGLEPILTDAFSAQVIQNDILPAFRTEDYPSGIVEGVDALIVQLTLDPAEAQARAAAVESEPSSLPVGTIVIIALVFLFIFIGLIRAASSGGGRRRGRGSSVLVWTAANVLSSALSSRGGGFGGGRGGGGFSGGGGSFGGGGASGGW